MADRLISQTVTGWCLRNWNFPLTDHIHVCQQSLHLRHRCRCQCGDEFGGEAAREAPIKGSSDG